jgi:hypothetical protein
MIFIEIENPRKMERAQNLQIFRFPRHDPVHDRGRHKLWRMGEPPNSRVGMRLAERSKDGRRAQNIARGAELNNQNILGDRIVIRASIAMDAFALVRSAGNITTEVAAIGMVSQLRITNYEISSGTSLMRIFIVFWIDPRIFSSSSQSASIDSAI